MSPPRKEEEQALFARDSLFRQKLNQLRSQVLANQSNQNTYQARRKELEVDTYLHEIQASFSKTDPKELERMTLLDSLTELYNRATLDRILSEELKRAQRYKKPLAMLILNVDELPTITLSHGNLTSDSILKGVANFLMSTIREVDIPARYDLTSFSIICPETNIEGASILAERLCNQIRLNRVSDLVRNWHVTLSIGVAASTLSRTSEEFSQQALKALSESKKAGGNNFRIA